MSECHELSCECCPLGGVGAAPGGPRDGSMRGELGRLGGYGTLELQFPGGMGRLSTSDCNRGENVINN